LILTVAQTVAYAAGIVAVLEIVPGDEDVELKLSEYRHLTDELRNRARGVLPSEFSILTRDNMISLLPQDEEEAECLADGCAVDIGRAIGADYVTQGQIRMFDGKLTLTIELFASASGNLLGTFVTESESVSGLLGTIREKAPAMFEKIPGAKKEEPKPVAEPSQPQQTIIVVQEKKDSVPVQPSTFKIGVIAKGGMAKSGAKDGKSGMGYSGGLIVVKNFGFVDFVPELLFSHDGFEINEKTVNIMKVDIPLTARVVVANMLGISLGAVLSLPLSATIEGEAVKDVEKFGVAATGGLSYLIASDLFIGASYEKYVTKNFSSVKDSNTDRVLCAIGYLF